MLGKAIVARLVAAGTGTEGDDLFWGKLPADPVRAIGTIETAGEPPRDTLDGPTSLDLPRCQVIARAKTRAEAFALAEAAYRALITFTGGVLAGQSIDRFKLQQLPFQMPDETLQHERYAFNVEAVRNGW